MALPAEEYPWAPAAGPGLVTAGTFLALADVGAGGRCGHSWCDHGWASMVEALEAGLGRHGLEPLSTRTAVVGVGSNRSPEVMRQKFLTAGVDPVVPMAPVVVPGIGVGHSAHVSRRGYLAAAPVAVAPEVGTALTLTWIDPAQLAALDATEPNYARVRLEQPPPAGVGSLWIYRSRWGVLTRDGHPVPLSAQADLHRLLASVPGLEAVFAAGPDPEPAAAEAVRRLMDPDLRGRVRSCLLAAGMVRASGLGEPVAESSVRTV